MKKLRLIITLIFIGLTQNLWAQSMIAEKKKSHVNSAIAASFPDYYPFSEVVGKENNEVLKTVFHEAMALFAQKNNFEISYNTNKNYNQTVKDVRQGNIDILLGIYNATKLYSGLDYVYPAILNNPIHIVVHSQNNVQIKDITDLKKYKGIYIESEYLSDYVIKNFKEHNISSVATAYEAYEKLFIGQVDYIAGSYYFNYAYTLKNGLNNYVSFSKQPLWNMPMFIGLSKISDNHKRLSNTLKRFITGKDFKKIVEQSLQDMIHNLEEQSYSIVPPKFVRQESLDELTPADEPLQTNEQFQQNIIEE